MKSVVILIVDDDRNICEYLKRLLEPLGSRIEVAYSLQEGLDLMRTIIPTPSFVFLDLNFPESPNSPESRAEQTLSYLPIFHQINPRASVVIITGLLDSKIKQMANTLGAAFREKPDLRTQEDALRALEEAIEIGQAHGIEPYEVTSKVLSKIAELRHPPTELATA